MSDFRGKFAEAAARITKGFTLLQRAEELPSEKEVRLQAVRRWGSQEPARTAFIPMLSDRITELEAAQAASFKDHPSMLIYQGALSEARRLRRMFEEFNRRDKDAPTFPRLVKEE